MTFPWLLCAVFGCTLWTGGKAQEWNHPRAYKPGLFGGEWYVVMNERPCLETLPPWPMTEKVDTTIRYPQLEAK